MNRASASIAAMVAAALGLKDHEVAMLLALGAPCILLFGSIYTIEQGTFNPFCFHSALPIPRSVLTVGELPGSTSSTT